MLEKNVGNAEAGVGTAKKTLDTFDTWGIAITDSNGKFLPPEDVLENITARMGERESPTQRVALLQDR